MLAILNEWIPIDDSTTKLIITGNYEYSCVVPSRFVTQLQEHSWCYEQSKGQVYATDLSLELPKTLGASSPRIYLWKYILFLHTGRIAKSWKRDNLSNYIPNHGEVIFKDVVSLETT